MKRFIKILLIVSLMIMLVPGTASAMNTESSDLNIIVGYNGNPVSGINVAVNRVAELKAVSPDTQFELTSEFAGSKVDFGDLSAAKILESATALDEYVIANDIQRTLAVTNSAGYAVFPNLTPGLYLVAQLDSENSDYVFAPYLIIVYNESGSNDFSITSYPKTEPAGGVLGEEAGPEPEIPNIHGYGPDGQVLGEEAKTGDDNNIMLWVVLMIAGAFGIIALFYILNAKRRSR